MQAQNDQLKLERQEAHAKRLQCEGKLVESTREHLETMKSFERANSNCIRNMTECLTKMEKQDEPVR